MKKSNSERQGKGHYHFQHHYNQLVKALQLARYTEIVQFLEIIFLGSLLNAEQIYYEILLNKSSIQTKNVLAESSAFSASYFVEKNSRLY
jgi:hypothetical protein